jgi:calcineurin-like phosphoesterase family protein
MTGRRILICGNHDRPAMTSDPEKRDRWVRRYRDEGGFDQVILPTEFTDWAVDYELPSGDVSLSHYPYSGDSQEVGASETE